MKGEWSINLGPIGFSRGHSVLSTLKYDQLRLGSLWATYTSKDGGTLTVNWRHYLVFHGMCLVNRRTHNFATPGTP